MVNRKLKDTPTVKKLKKTARDCSIKEGIFAASQNSFGTYYISPFAIAVNASNSLVAFLTSMIGLLGPLSQLFSSRLIERFSRKKIVMKGVLGEALLWLPLILVAILFHKGILVNMLPLLVVLFFSLSVIISNIAVPAWFSWMGDIVNNSHRGRWFSKRSLLTGFVAITLAVISSFFLDYFKQKGLAMIGFIALFFLAFISRIISWRIFKQQYEPKIKLRKRNYFTFFEFVIQAPRNNFGKFSIFRAFIGFSGAVSSSLIAVYLLRNLGFSYSTYIIVTLSGTFLSLFFIEIWGNFADKYGNYRTLAITSIVIPIIPILWILYDSPLYLIFIPAAIGGITWAGFNLATTNFIYDNVSQQKRGFAVSYYNLLNGIGIFLGAGLASILIRFLKTDFIEPILAIFIIGGVLRMIGVFWWLPKIKEVRKTKKFDSRLVLKNIIFKEAKPTVIEEVHQIMTINKYLKK